MLRPLIVGPIWEVVSVSFGQVILKKEEEVPKTKADLPPEILVPTKHHIQYLFSIQMVEMEYNTAVL